MESIVFNHKKTTKNNLVFFLYYTINIIILSFSLLHAKPILQNKQFFSSHSLHLFPALIFRKKTLPSIFAVLFFDFPWRARALFFLSNFPLSVCAARRGVDQLLTKSATERTVVVVVMTTTCLVAFARYSLSLSLSHAFTAVARSRFVSQN